MKTIELYTDGSCLNNPGFGGWAYILRFGEYEKTESGAEENTTNNRMELLAIIKALEVLKEPCEILLFTDSKLMVQSINEWLDSWIQKDFKGKKNVDLWKQYLHKAQIHKMKAFWIKAHNGHKYNERCDFLARTAARKLAKEKNEKN
ncbi:ribonuclease HI [Campylobacter sp. MIT 21-1685]|uniref:ribonuclease HI n=1 Tax=unclassified Campylobacter TaxID=2593542 RepID=UPI00224B0C0E|nr:MULTISPECIES: ribonuclease HI [unclassified Campylobacter]MCX2683287.1 ribonuclease HI [Campylobacter sp. MIT 21-1684]MCX2751520.1 ribonuclease HI [Campylobacter sp. MIT 21-1682]MCX2807719.1 ribonuclease HI [Campylobacter sp. MIT 21-1685]